MSLVDLTFAWLQKEWAHEVDFVVCKSPDAVSGGMMVVAKLPLGIQRDRRQRKVRFDVSIG